MFTGRRQLQTLTGDRIIQQFRIHDFPNGGMPTPDFGAETLFGRVFVENCMKMEDTVLTRGTSLAPCWIRQSTGILKFIRPS